MITLASDKPQVHVPANVTVPDGATQAQFSVTTDPVTSPLTATITATDPAGIKKTTSVTVNPVPKVLDVIVPSPIAGGSTVTGVVDLDNPA